MSMITMELVPDNPTIKPENVTGVVVLNSNHVTKRWGILGYLVQIAPEALDQTIETFGNSGWDVYLVHY